MAHSSLEKSLMGLIIEGIETQTKRAFDNHKKVMLEEFSKQLDQEQDNIIAKTALRISKNFSINTVEDRIIIEVRNFK
jgi:hypothetical protein